MNDNAENKIAVRQEWQQAFEAEFKHIRARRDGSYSSNDTAQAPDNLVGLAFSGGGIRSATFGLGVLEALKKFDLLKKVDYLSTVSGGGYIGAWLSGNCKRTAEHNKENQAPEPDWLSPNADWQASVDHLRRYSNYLSPKLSLLSADTWSMGTIWLRNTLLVQVMVILTIAALLLLPRPLYVAFDKWTYGSAVQWLTIFLYILAVVGIGGNLLRLNHPNNWFLTIENWLPGVAGAFACLLTAWLIGVSANFDLFAPHIDNPYIAGVIALLLVVAGFFLQPAGLRILKIFWHGNNSPKEINYTQAYVQALVVLPMLVVGFLVTVILKGELRYDVGKACDKALDAACTFAQLDSFGGFFAIAWKQWPLPLSVVFASLWLLSFCSVRTCRNKGWLIALMAPIPVMLVLHALLSVIMVVLHGWKLEVGGNAGQWHSFVWTPAMILFSFSITVIALLGMLGRQSNEDVREWWSRFGAWLAIYGFGWMMVAVTAVYGPLLIAMLIDNGPWKTIGSGWVGATLAGVFAGKSASTGGTANKAMSAIPKELLAKIAPFIFIGGLLVAISMALHLIIAVNSGATIPILALIHAISKDGMHWQLLSNANPVITWYVILGCIACVLLLAWRVDINEFSLNAFYRSRLVRCYLGATRFRPGERKPQNFTGFDDNDDLQLATLVDGNQTQAPSGPLHIVNCALNLGGSSDLSLHTRHSAIFTLNPLFCGSRYRKRDQSGNIQEIGYASTALFGGAKDQPTLGQAISVSGAAASPNMGYHTSPAVAFLMTLFNARLGWWFPNPSKSRLNQPAPTFSLDYLMRELFGLANEKSEYLAISDGGHFENLAAYELVKRKCQVIIISDGECDPNLQFEGLGSLIRMCRVDLNAIIDIDVRTIHPEDQSAWSRNRCAVGTINYDDASSGTLIYIKASMNGHEDTPVMQYKSAHPDFPHESTGDQFYGEDQFESYRNLGFSITEQLFNPVKDEPIIGNLAEKLAAICSPTLPNSSQFTHHANHLIKLWSKLGGNEGLKSLDSELTAKWPNDSSPEFRSAFYLCSEMIQLMENVYLDLSLEETWFHPDNQGWRTLFKQWAASVQMQQTWQLTAQNYGLRFQYFWDRHLVTH